MVWTFTEEREWICWAMEVKDGPTKKEPKMETTEEIHGRGEQRHADS